MHLQNFIGVGYEHKISHYRNMGSHNIETIGVIWMILQPKIDMDSQITQRS